MLCISLECLTKRGIPCTFEKMSEEERESKTIKCEMLAAKIKCGRNDGTRMTERENEWQNER